MRADGAAAGLISTPLEAFSLAYLKFLAPAMRSAYNQARSTSTLEIILP